MQNTQQSFDRILSPQYSNQIAGHSYFDAAQAVNKQARQNADGWAGAGKQAAQSEVDYDQKAKLRGDVDRCSAMQNTQQSFDTILSS